MTAELARPPVQVGPASPGDAASIARLVRRSRGECLPLSEGEVLARLGEFEVARGPGGEVLGCAAIRRAPGRAPELRSVSVDRRWRGAGIGRRLVERAAERAQAARQDLFCVSRSPEFFERIGFVRLPTSAVPWRPGAARGGRPRCALVRRSRGVVRRERGA